MPVPKEITDGPYLHVGDYPITVGPAGNAGRAALRNRTFHAYLELYFQGKHDGQVRNYCDRQNPKIARRDSADTQVAYARGETMAQFYLARGRTASTRTAKLMNDTWASAPQGNDGTYTPDKKNIMAVQREVQDDGYQYDMSFWYCGQDIYVTFHCYPPRG